MRAIPRGGRRRSSIPAAGVVQQVDRLGDHVAVVTGDPARPDGTGMLDEETDRVVNQRGHRDLRAPRRHAMARAAPTRTRLAGDAVNHRGDLVRAREQVLHVVEDEDHRLSAEERQQR